MSNTLTLRAKTIRLAATMPKGPQRTALLNVLAARKPPLKRQAPDGHYQVLLRREHRIDGGTPYISDAPNIQAAMRDARKSEALSGVVLVEIYDSLGNFFGEMVNGRLKAV